MSTIVQHSRDHRGMLSSICPRCRVLFAYWDDEDLDADGNLRCYCEEEDDDDEDLSPRPGDAYCDLGHSFCVCPRKDTE